MLAPPQCSNLSIDKYFDEMFKSMNIAVKNPGTMDRSFSDEIKLTGQKV